MKPRTEKIEVFNTLDNALAEVINKYEGEDKPTHLEIFMSIEALRLKMIHSYTITTLNMVFTRKPDDKKYEYIS